MSALRIPLMHARDLESVRPLSNDERLATWAQRYFLRGHHRNPSKPRIRVTVPEPLAQPSAHVSAPPADAIPHTVAARSDDSGDYSAGVMA